MAAPTIQFRLEGVVSLEDFRTAVNAFASLIDMLTDQADPNAPIEWDIKTLRAGSAFVQVSGTSETAEGELAVEEVRRDYSRIAEIAARRQMSDWAGIPRPIREQVAMLTGMLNGRVPRAAMGTNNDEWIVEAPISVEPPTLIQDIEDRKRQRTSIRGQVVTLDDKRATYFTLKEAFTRRMVRCWPESKYRAMLGEYWSTQAWIVVEGSYNTFTEKPTMTDITDIIPLGAAPPEGWKQAFGIAPRKTGGVQGTSADVVRKVRDA